MSTWSLICSTQFVKGLASRFVKNSFNSTNRSHLINVYYVFSPSNQLLESSSAVYQDCVKQIRYLLPDYKFLLYPLTQKTFHSCRWETSARLLVILEVPSLDNQHYKEQFSHEIDIISQFLVRGGRVLILLHPSKTGEGSSLCNMLSSMLHCENNSVHADQTIWKWSYKKPILIGHFVDREHPSSLAVLRLDCLNSDTHNLEHALILLGMECAHNLSNTESVANASLSDTVLNLVCYTTEFNSKSQESINLLKETNLRIKLYLDPALLPIGFDWNDYLAYLNTKHLGKLVFWANSLPSSWTLCSKFFDRLTSNSGLLVCSNVQTQAKGREVNEWISPLGQAAFTFHLTLSADSFAYTQRKQFFSHAACVQHLVALSIVFATRRLIMQQLRLIPNDMEANDIDEETLTNLQYPGPQVLIKWPNDVYIVESDHDNNFKMFSILGKLAGVLTKCTLTNESQMQCLIGCGINVNNEVPTVCLKSLLAALPNYDREFNLTTAMVISLTLTHLEALLSKISTPDNDHNIGWALNLYKKCWLHTDQKLRVMMKTPQSISNDPSSLEQQHHHQPHLSFSETFVHCTVVGLDAFGYLLVADCETGATFSVHPDGNSMDMLCGLIRPT